MSAIQSTNLVGQVFNRLTVLAHVMRGRRHFLLCRCECGKEKEVRRESVLINETVSCGCFAREASSKRFKEHGLSKTSTFRIWQGILQRCTNPKNPDYPRYGERGITVCERWLTSFANFCTDMGERPGTKTIDRYPNNDGNYEPGNCRWANRKEQGRNRSDNRNVTYNGLTMTVTEWAERLGIKRVTLDGRITRWGVERAMNHSGANR